MESIDLKAYLKRLLNNWLIILLCCIIGGSAAFVYSKFFATPIYSSKVTISVNNSDWTSGVSINDIETTLKLVESCVFVLEHDEMAEKVSQSIYEQTGKIYSVGSIKGSLSFSRTGNTNFIKVVARSKSPEFAALLCNTVAAKAPDIIVRNVAGIQVTVLEEDGAKINAFPVSPNVRKNVTIGLAISFVFACLIVLLLMFLDNTVTEVDVLKEKYGLSVLGVVPNYGAASKKKRYEYMTY